MFATCTGKWLALNLLAADQELQESCFSEHRDVAEFQKHFEV